MCNHKWVKYGENKRYKYFICMHCRDRSKVIIATRKRIPHAVNSPLIRNINRIFVKCVK